MMAETEIHRLEGSDFFAPNGLPLLVLRRDPQPPYPVHTHGFMELVVIVSGTGILTGPKGEVSIGKGAVFVINGDTAHGYRELKDLHLVNVLFDLERLAIPLFDLGKSPGFHFLFTIDPVTRFRELEQIVTALEDAELAELLRMIDSMEQALTNEAPGSSFLGIARFMEIMYFISSAYDRRHAGERRFPYRLGEALGYIESHLTEPIPLQTLIDIAGMSESSLLRAFKNVTGHSPTDYHRMKRIERACWYLAHGSHSITEISEALGYEDSNYFSRQFRSITGVSPREYRAGARRRAGN